MNPLNLLQLEAVVEKTRTVVLNDGTPTTYLLLKQLVEGKRTPMRITAIFRDDPLAYIASQFEKGESVSVSGQLDISKPKNGTDYVRMFAKKIELKEKHGF